ncbi:MAG: tRNA pseudouridine(38-40) synthase TruA [Lachnospiraceae bacterium]|nr:tRNA pseudouridine(38-40) synthase TruA [Lachnospiraceae bacterium]
MKNFKIKVAYDGSRYKGWQVQKSTKDTIQGKIESVLEKLACHPVDVIGSGRTDAGVHAKGQIANFHMEDNFSSEYLLTYLNEYLPEDIAVLSVEEAEERFHSRYHAVEKTYQYRIHTAKIPNVFERRYLYTFTEPLQIDKMRQAAEYLTGTKDFTSFCGNKHMKKSAVRSVYKITIEEKEEEIRITYSGNGFLQNMIRIMTGTLLEVGCGRKDPEDIEEILSAKNREKAGYTAPAQGLTLLEVKY